MGKKFRYIQFLILISTILSCADKNEPEFELLKMNSNNEIEFLKKKHLTLNQLSKSLDSLTNLNNRIYIMLDVARESSYSEFYLLRRVLQKHRNELLISLKKPVEQINYYTISAEPEERELSRFSPLQTIEINRTATGNYVINKDSTVLLSELRTTLLNEAMNLLSLQMETKNDDEVIMFWINDLNKTTYGEYIIIGETLNEVIRDLKDEKQNVITRIIELRKKDDNM